MAKLGGGVDELGGDLLQLPSLGGLEEGLPQSDDSLLGAHHGALDHEVVLIDHTIVREPAHRGDVLLSQIKLGGGVVLDAALANLVNLLVQLGTVVVAILTSAGHRPLNGSRMPSTNTSHLHG